MEAEFRYTKKEEPDFELDEGWWASVLADEKAAQAPAPRAPVAKAAELPAISIDWERVQSYCDADEVICLEVYSCNRGGLLVRGDAIQGFVPVSHLIEMPCAFSTEERRKLLNGYIGRELQLKVIECEKEMGRIVLSERAALAGEGRRRELFSSLKVGEVVFGTVTNITDFGVFVDLGGLEGLVHVSELSWGRVQHPMDVVQLNDEVRALVLSVSEENGRVGLSLKRLCPNPWEVICEKYQSGEVVEATITKVMRFGAFAQLKEGVEGLIHISTIQLPEHIDTLEDYIQVGSVVMVRILHIDSERRRLGLGLNHDE